MPVRVTAERLVVGCLLAPLAASPALAQTPTANAEPAPAQTATLQFDIAAFDVIGNTLLPPDVVEEAVYPHLGPGKTPDDVEAARVALQEEFAKRGYATVSVLIPEQSVDSGAIRLEVVPQRIGAVEVVGAERTSREELLRLAPSLRPGAIPNFDALQRDIVALNQSADRRVTPEIVAGNTPGTLDVQLAVDESSPLHGSVEINNYGSAQTTDLRIAGSLRYDDLWGLGHSIGISTQLAPERTEDGVVISGSYVARLGDVQLLAYGLVSESDIAVLDGLNVIGSGFVGGAQVIVPLSSREGFYNTLTFGADYKDFEEDLVLGADRDAAPIAYVPLTVAWRGDWRSQPVTADVTVTATYGLRGVGSDEADFDNKRFGARPNFFHLRAEGRYQAEIGAGLQAFFHPALFWSPDPLISNEQFPIGGIDSVRGYFESEALADYGFFYQSELRSPPLGSLMGQPADAVRLHLFLDSGIGELHRALPSQDARFELVSTGVGARIKLFDLVNGALDLGVPLLDGPSTSAGEIVARFRIWGDF